LFGRIPNSGEELTYELFKFKIQSVDVRRIKKVKVSTTKIDHNVAGAPCTVSIEAKDRLTSALDANMFSYTLRKSFARSVITGDAIGVGGIENIDEFFNNEDLYFTMCLKAMVAKVLTAVGTYSMLNRPPFYKMDKLKDSPAGPYRQILGGADKSTAEVVSVNPEAAELYVRLPLLVEFYRNIHHEGEKAGGDKEKRRITVIPEFDNIFAGIVTLLYGTVIDFCTFDIPQGELQVNVIT
jgi:hypothetical protein